MDKRNNGKQRDYWKSMFDKYDQKNSSGITCPCASGQQPIIEDIVGPPNYSIASSSTFPSGCDCTPVKDSRSTSTWSSRATSSRAASKSVDTCPCASSQHTSPSINHPAAYQPVYTQHQSGFSLDCSCGGVEEQPTKDQSQSAKSSNICSCASKQSKVAPQSLKSEDICSCTSEPPKSEKSSSAPKSADICSCSSKAVSSEPAKSVTCSCSSKATNQSLPRSIGTCDCSSTSAQSRIPDQPQTRQPKCDVNPCCPCSNKNQPRANLSNFSMNDDDVVYIERIKGLLDSEKVLKKEVNDLAQVEKSFQERLAHRKCLGDTRAGGGGDYEKENLKRLNKKLEQSNRLLENEIEKVASNLKRTKDTLETPMKKEIDMEKRKIADLESQLRSCSCDLESRRENGERELVFLQNQLQTSNQQLNDLNLVNTRLKEELCLLNCRANQLQTDIINQKLSEIHTLSRLSAQGKLTNLTGPKYFKGAPGSGPGKKDDLNAIARNLSKLLAEANDCNTCQRAHTDLIDTVEYIKNLVDMVNTTEPEDRRSSGSSVCECVDLDTREIYSPQKIRSSESAIGPEGDIGYPVCPVPTRDEQPPEEPPPPPAVEVVAPPPMVEETPTEEQKKPEAEEKEKVEEEECYVCDEYDPTTDVGQWEDIVCPIRKKEEPKKDEDEVCYVCEEEEPKEEVEGKDEDEPKGEVGEVVAQEEKPEGEVTDEAVTEPAITEGEVTEGEVTEGEVTEGEVTEGEVTEGEVTEGEVTAGEITAGEITEGEVTEGEVTEDEDVTEPAVTEGVTEDGPTEALTESGVTEGVTEGPTEELTEGGVTEGVTEEGPTEESTEVGLTEGGATEELTEGGVTDEPLTEGEPMEEAVSKPEHPVVTEQVLAEGAEPVTRPDDTTDEEGLPVEEAIKERPPKPHVEPGQEVEQVADEHVAEAGPEEPKKPHTPGEGEQYADEGREDAGSEETKRPHKPVAEGEHLADVEPEEDARTEVTKKPPHKPAEGEEYEEPEEGAAEVTKKPPHRPAEGEEYEEPEEGAPEVTKKPPHRPAEGEDYEEPREGVEVTKKPPHRPAEGEQYEEPEEGAEVAKKPPHRPAEGEHYEEAEEGAPEVTKKPPHRPAEGEQYEEPEEGAPEVTKKPPHRPAEGEQYEEPEEGASEVPKKPPHRPAEGERYEEPEEGAPEVTKKPPHRPAEGEDYEEPREGVEVTKKPPHRPAEGEQYEEPEEGAEVAKKPPHRPAEGEHYEEAEEGEPEVTKKPPQRPAEREEYGEPEEGAEEAKKPPPRPAEGDRYDELEEGEPEVLKKPPHRPAEGEQYADEEEAGPEETKRPHEVRPGDQYESGEDVPDKRSDKGSPHKRPSPGGEDMPKVRSKELVDQIVQKICKCLSDQPPKPCACEVDHDHKPGKPDDSGIPTDVLFVTDEDKFSKESSKAGIVDSDDRVHKPREDEEERPASAPADILDTHTLGDEGPTGDRPLEDGKGSEGALGPLETRSTDGAYITTAVAGDGILEVTTEGPAGIIETTLTVTESGNIEVVTDVTEFPVALDGEEPEKITEIGPETDEEHAREDGDTDTDKKEIVGKSSEAGAPGGEGDEPDKMQQEDLEGDMMPPVCDMEEPGTHAEAEIQAEVKCISFEKETGTCEIEERQEVEAVATKSTKSCQCGPEEIDRYCICPEFLEGITAGESGTEPEDQTAMGEESELQALGEEEVTPITEDAELQQIGEEEVTEMGEESELQALGEEEMAPIPEEAEMQDLGEEEIVQMEEHPGFTEEAFGEELGEEGEVVQEEIKEGEITEKEITEGEEVAVLEEEEEAERSFAEGEEAVLEEEVCKVCEEDEGEEEGEGEAMHEEEICIVCEEEEEEEGKHRFVEEGIEAEIGEGDKIGDEEKHGDLVDVDLETKVPSRTPSCDCKAVGDRENVQLGTTDAELSICFSDTCQAGQVIKPRKEVAGGESICDCATETVRSKHTVCKECMTEPQGKIAHEMDEMEYICVCKQQSRKTICKECSMRPQVKICTPDICRSGQRIEDDEEYICTCRQTSNKSICRECQERNRRKRDRRDRDDRLLLDVGTSCKKSCHIFISKSKYRDSDSDSSEDHSRSHNKRKRSERCLCQRSSDNLQFRSEYSDTVCKEKKYRSASRGICAIPCKSVSTQQNLDECVSTCPMQVSQETNTPKGQRYPETRKPAKRTERNAATVISTPRNYATNTPQPCLRAPCPIREDMRKKETSSSRNKSDSSSCDCPSERSTPPTLPVSSPKKRVSTSSDTTSCSCSSEPSSAHKNKARRGQSPTPKQENIDDASCTCPSERSTPSSKKGSHNSGRQSSDITSCECSSEQSHIIKGKKRLSADITPEKSSAKRRDSADIASCLCPSQRSTPSVKEETKDNLSSLCPSVKSPPASKKGERNSGERYSSSDTRECSTLSNISKNKRRDSGIASYSVPSEKTTPSVKEENLSCLCPSEKSTPSSNKRERTSGGRSGPSERTTPSVKEEDLSYVSPSQKSTPSSVKGERKSGGRFSSSDTCECSDLSNISKNKRRDSADIASCSCPSERTTPSFKEEDQSCLCPSEKSQSSNKERRTSGGRYSSSDTCECSDLSNISKNKRRGSADIASCSCPSERTTPSVKEEDLSCICPSEKSAIADKSSYKERGNIVDDTCECSQEETTPSTRSAERGTKQSSKDKSDESWCQCSSDCPGKEKKKIRTDSKDKLDESSCQCSSDCAGKEKKKIRTESKDKSDESSCQCSSDCAGKETKKIRTDIKDKSDESSCQCSSDCAGKGKKKIRTENIYIASCVCQPRRTPSPNDKVRRERGGSVDTISCLCPSDKSEKSTLPMDKRRSIDTASCVCPSERRGLSNVIEEETMSCLCPSDKSAKSTLPRDKRRSIDTVSCVCPSERGGSPNVIEDETMSCICPLEKPASPDSCACPPERGASPNQRVVKKHWETPERAASPEKSLPPKNVEQCEDADTVCCPCSKRKPSSPRGTVIKQTSDHLSSHCATERLSSPKRNVTKKASDNLSCRCPPEKTPPLKNRGRGESIDTDSCACPTGRPSSPKRKVVKKVSDNLSCHCPAGRSSSPKGFPVVFKKASDNLSCHCSPERPSSPKEKVIRKASENPSSHSPTERATSPRRNVMKKASDNLSCHCPSESFPPKNKARRQSVDTAAHPIQRPSSPNKKVRPKTSDTLSCRCPSEKSLSPMAKGRMETDTASCDCPIERPASSKKKVTPKSSDGESRDSPSKKLLPPKNKGRRESIDAVSCDCPTERPSSPRRKIPQKPSDTLSSHYSEKSLPSRTKGRRDSKDTASCLCPSEKSDAMSCACPPDRSSKGSSKVGSGSIDTASCLCPSERSDAMSCACPPDRSSKGSSKVGSGSIDTASCLCPSERSDAMSCACPPDRSSKGSSKVGSGSIDTASCLCPSEKSDAMSCACPPGRSSKESVRSPQFSPRSETQVLSCLCSTRPSSPEFKSALSTCYDPRYREPYQDSESILDDEDRVPCLCKPIRSKICDLHNCPVIQESQSTLESFDAASIRSCDCPPGEAYRNASLRSRSSTRSSILSPSLNSMSACESICVKFNAKYCNMETCSQRTPSGDSSFSMSNKDMISIPEEEVIISVHDQERPRRPGSPTRSAPRSAESSDDSSRPCSPTTCGRISFNTYQRDSTTSSQREQHVPLPEATVVAGSPRSMSISEKKPHVPINVPPCPEHAIPTGYIDINTPRTSTPPSTPMPHLQDYHAAPPTHPGAVLYPGHPPAATYSRPPQYEVAPHHLSDSTHHDDSQNQVVQPTRHPQAPSHHPAQDSPSQNPGAAVYEEMLLVVVVEHDGHYEAPVETHITHQIEEAPHHGVYQTPNEQEPGSTESDGFSPQPASHLGGATPYHQDPHRGHQTEAPQHKRPSVDHDSGRPVQISYPVGDIADRQYQEPHAQTSHPDAQNAYPDAQIFDEDASPDDHRTEAPDDARPPIESDSGAHRKPHGQSSDPDAPIEPGHHLPQAEHTKPHRKPWREASVDPDGVQHETDQGDKPVEHKPVTKPSGGVVYGKDSPEGKESVESLCGPCGKTPKKRTSAPKPAAAKSQSDRQLGKTSSISSKDKGRSPDKEKERPHQAQSSSKRESFDEKEDPSYRRAKPHVSKSSSKEQVDQRHEDQPTEKKRPHQSESSSRHEPKKQVSHDGERDGVKSPMEERTRLADQQADQIHEDQRTEKKRPHQTEISSRHESKEQVPHDGVKSPREERTRVADHQADQRHEDQPTEKNRPHQTEISSRHESKEHESHDDERDGAKSPREERARAADQLHHADQTHDDQPTEKKRPHQTQSGSRQSFDKTATTGGRGPYHEGEKQRPDKKESKGMGSYVETVVIDNPHAHEESHEHETGRTDHDKKGPHKAQSGSRHEPKEQASDDGDRDSVRSTRGDRRRPADHHADQGHDDHPTNRKQPRQTQSGSRHEPKEQISHKDERDSVKSPREERTRSSARKAERYEDQPTEKKRPHQTLSGSRHEPREQVSHEGERDSVKSPRDERTRSSAHKPGEKYEDQPAEKKQPHQTQSGSRHDSKEHVSYKGDRHSVESRRGDRTRTADPQADHRHEDAMEHKQPHQTRSGSKKSFDESAATDGRSSGKGQREHGALSAGDKPKRRPDQSETSSRDESFVKEVLPDDKKSPSHKKRHSQGETDSKESFDTSGTRSASHKGGKDGSEYSYDERPSQKGSKADINKHDPTKKGRLDGESARTHEDDVLAGSTGDEDHSGKRRRHEDELVSGKGKGKTSSSDDHKGDHRHGEAGSEYSDGERSSQKGSKTGSHKHDPTKSGHLDGESDADKMHERDEVADSTGDDDHSGKGRHKEESVSGKGDRGGSRRHTGSLTGSEADGSTMPDGKSSSRQSGKDGDKGSKSSLSKGSAQGSKSRIPVPQTGSHPPGCHCKKCNIDEYSCDTETSSVEVVHRPDCRCNKCNLDICTCGDPLKQETGGGEHPPNCDCVDCLCDPSRFSQSSKGYSDQDHPPSDGTHPPGCDCVDCICKPCADKLMEKQKAFVCPTLVPPKKRHHPDCACPMCICHECLMVPDCECNPCQCKKCADEKEMQHRIDCTCPKCICDPCGDLKHHPQEHRPDCTCSECICNPCEDVKVERARHRQLAIAKGYSPDGRGYEGYGPEAYDPEGYGPEGHGPTCECYFCMCKRCCDPKIRAVTNPPSLFPNLNLENLNKKYNFNDLTPIFELFKPTEHPADCECAVCACRPCHNQPPPSKTDHGTEPMAPEPHRKECTCDRCVCDPCDDPIFHTSHSKTRQVRPVKHGPGCKCPRCVCEPCEIQSTNHGPGCECPKCVCKPCELKTQAKPTDHGPGCKCPRCVCDPCDMSTKPAAKAVGHAPNCGCPKCVCDPCDLTLDATGEPANHGPDCPCSRCVCDPCTMKPVSPTKPTDNGPDYKSFSPTAKSADPAYKTTPTSKPVSHGPVCSYCPSCACDPCDKESIPMAKPTGDHGPTYRTFSPPSERTDQRPDYQKTQTSKPTDDQGPAYRTFSPPSERTDQRRDYQTTQTSKSTDDHGPAYRTFSPPSERTDQGSDYKTTPSAKPRNHGPDCKCPRCVCDLCEIEPTTQGKPANHASDCKCPKCVCDPCGPTSSVKPKPHGSDCKCPRCVCDPCEIEPSTQVKPTNHVPGCECPKCVCDPCEPASLFKPKDHGPDCKCPRCVCDPCEIEPTTQVKPTNHGPGCECPRCVCDPCEPAASFKPKDHGPDCKCPRCVCDPCEIGPTTQVKPTNHGPGCECPKCVCDPCEPASSFKPTNYGRDADPKKPGHGAGCLCPRCICDPCKSSPAITSKPTIHGPDCTCPKCICDPCDDGDKKPPENRQKRTHGVDCQCPRCVCEPREMRTASEQTPIKTTHQGGDKVDHDPNCKCPSCYCDPCKLKKQTPDLPHGIKHKEDCRCKKCACEPCMEEPHALKIPKEKSHKKNCKCEDCTCRKDKQREKKQKRKAKASSKDVDEMDVKKPVKDAKQIEELEGLMAQIRCACNDAEIQAARTIPAEATIARKTSSTRDSLENLTTALVTLQEKCMDKDKMIDAMAQELRSRPNTNKPYTQFDYNEPLPDCSQYVAAVSKPRKTGVCFTDASPMKITEVSRISADTLLVKWSQPTNCDVVGYEVIIDGELRSRVHSSHRTSSVIFGIQIKKRTQVSVYAVTQFGRCDLPAEYVFET